MLAARPKPRKGQTPPVHRFSRLSSPSEWTQPHVVEGEDDILHAWDLPDFSDPLPESATQDTGASGQSPAATRSIAASRALGQQDAELLLSYLTVPYLRIPLIVSFFASDDRIHALQSLKLQSVLDAAIFEPGAHLPLASTDIEPVDVPTSRPDLLGTPHHLLLNELSRSPDTLMRGALQLAQQAVELDTWTYEASTTAVILYVVRFASRLDNYVSFLLAYDSDAHDSIRGKPYRQLELSPGVAAKLENYRTELRRLLWGELRQLLLRWYHKLVKQNERTSTDDDLIDRNARRMCSLHA